MGHLQRFLNWRVIKDTKKKTEFQQKKKIVYKTNLAQESKHKRKLRHFLLFFVSIFLFFLGESSPIVCNVSDVSFTSHKYFLCILQNTATGFIFVSGNTPSIPSHTRLLPCSSSSMINSISTFVCFSLITCS